MPVLQGNQQPGRTGEADLLLQPGYRVVEPTVQAKDHPRHITAMSIHVMSCGQLYCYHRSAFIY